LTNKIANLAGIFFKKLLMKILAIESSCDETAVAIVDEKKNILAQVLNSQIEIHKKFGGVVPELSARSHVEILDQLILQALAEAKLTLDEISAFAATSGPGLIGGVIIGMMTAKTLASVYQKPFLAVNHLEGHALTVRLTSDIEFPYLLLLFSGGHCQILLARGLGDYEKIGETIDDALGEAFDKVAKMLGLEYPGGPIVERMAKEGDKNRFKFPKPLIDTARNDEHRFNFSFSGLKTAVRREIEKLIGAEFSPEIVAQKLTYGDKCDICASFQKTATEIILNRLANVFALKNLSYVKKIVLAGGVAANRYIFTEIDNWAKEKDLILTAPPIKLCTDNAVMIAWVGIEKLKAEKIDALDFKPRARWDLGS
jgi:N6-L-threonylcarbamoyladenine synthase